jgi:hypothetical protein
MPIFGERARNRLGGNVGCQSGPSDVAPNRNICMPL